MIFTHDTEWDGLECPKCGCRRVDVQTIRHREGGNRRVRICCNCGRKMFTLELPLCGVRRHVKNQPAMPA